MQGGAHWPRPVSAQGTPLQSDGNRAILYKEYCVIKGGFPLSFCDKCGAYIPIGETACPACGYDPQAEAKKAAEAAARAAEEERRRAAEEARREREAAAEAERREREEAARKAREEAERKTKEEAERRYAEQQKRWQQDPWQQTHTGGPAQGQYTSQRTAGASQAQYASQRTGQTKSGEYRQEKTYSTADDAMRRKAAESVDRQKLSVFSYLGPFWLIPAITQNGDPFMKYHTEQGLGLIIFWALTKLVSMKWGWVGTVGGIICTIGAIKGIANVLQGKRAPLPVIGDLVQSVKESIAKHKK